MNEYGYEYDLSCVFRNTFHADFKYVVTALHIIINNPQAQDYFNPITASLELICS